MKILGVIHETANSALDARCAGAAAEMLAAGRRITTVSLPKLGVDMSSDDQISDRLVSEFRADASIDGCLTVGQVMVPATLAALKRVGKKKGMY